MEIKKIRKIVLLSILALAIVVLILNIVSKSTSMNFNMWVYDNYVIGGGKKITMDKPDKTAALIGAGIVGIIGLIFILFALIYLFGTKNKRANLRKWPYIVMIVGASIGVIMLLVAIFSNVNSMPVKLKDEVKTKYPAIYSAINQKWSDSYESTIRMFGIVGLVISSIGLGLKAYSLVLIKKQKENEDVAFSETVKQSAKPKAKKTKNVDLP